MGGPERESEPDVRSGNRKHWTCYGDVTVQRAYGLVAAGEDVARAVLMLRGHIERRRQALQDPPDMNSGQSVLAASPERNSYCCSMFIVCDHCYYGLSIGGAVERGGGECPL